MYFHAIFLRARSFNFHLSLTINSSELRPLPLLISPQISSTLSLPLLSTMSYPPPESMDRLRGEELRMSLLGLGVEGGAANVDSAIGAR